MKKRLEKRERERPQVINCHLKLNIQWETDSTQVPRGKDAKNSEKRVKRTWSRWNGSVYFQWLPN